MGDAFGEGYAADGEVPVHRVELAPFHIDATAVTNAQFAGFVKATGHVTDAERFETSSDVSRRQNHPVVEHTGLIRGEPRVPLRQRPQHDVKEFRYAS